MPREQERELVRRDECGPIPLPGVRRFPTARLGRRLPDRHPQAGGQRWTASLPPIPKGWLPMRPLRSRRAITLRAHGARTVPPQSHVRWALAIALAGLLVFAAPAASLDRPEQRLAAMTNIGRHRHDL